MRAETIETSNDEDQTTDGRKMTEEGAEEIMTGISETIRGEEDPTVKETTTLTIHTNTQEEDNHQTDSIHRATDIHVRVTDNNGTNLTIMLVQMGTNSTMDTVTGNIPEALHVGARQGGPNMASPEDPHTDARHQTTCSSPGSEGVILTDVTEDLIIGGGTRIKGLEGKTTSSNKYGV